MSNQPGVPGALSVSQEALGRLQHVIEANPSIDWRTFSFETPDLPRALQWRGHEEQQEELVPLLKAYQRLLRILPEREEHRALPLLRAGLHSAIQIASLSKEEFARRWAELFPGEQELGDTVYQHAVGRRSYVLLQHIKTVQGSEPHYRAARFQ
jgi:hypothetical protein